MPQFYQQQYQPQSPNFQQQQQQQFAPQLSQQQYRQQQPQPQPQQQQQYADQYEDYSQDYQQEQPYQDYDGYSSEPDQSILQQTRPLILHQGSTVQFPSKDPNPGVQHPEAPHLGEEKHAMIRPTVCQFLKNIPDPNARPVDGSHLGEEENRPILRQGGLVQFPHKYNPPRDHVKGYQPVDDVVKESLPLAEVEHPDHLLPSQARRQQTYITHPTAQTIKPVYGVETGPKSRNVPEWPPKRTCVRDLPRVGFNSGNIHPEGKCSSRASDSQFSVKYFIQAPSTSYGLLQSLPTRKSLAASCHPRARARLPTPGIPRLTAKIFPLIER